MFRLLRRFGGGDEPKPEPAPDPVTGSGELTGKVRDPQYTPPSPERPESAFERRMRWGPDWID